MYSKKKLTEKVHRLRELERQMSDIDTEIENLKDEIKDDMNKRGVTELVGDDWKVTWNSYDSTRFNQKVFKEDHPELYEQYRHAYAVRKFLVK